MQHPIDNRRGQAARARRGAWALVAGLAAGLLAGCSSAPTTPEPTPIRLLLSASETLNPDINGRASPVVVRLFRLKQSTTFVAADYFTLTDRELETLGNDVLFRESLTLSPGESTQREYAMESSGQALGILVGYRDIEASTWRATVAVVRPQESWLELPQFMRWGDPTEEFEAHLDALAVTLQPRATP